MSIFEQLTQTVADCDIIWGALREREREAEDVIKATASRIAADRAAADERAATLLRQSQDPDRPPIVRQLAAQELERSRGRVIEPTDGETEAFAAAMNGAREALRDARTVQSRLRDLFAAANDELCALRDKTLGRNGLDASLTERHLDSAQRDFDRLWPNGRPEDQP